MPQKQQEPDDQQPTTNFKPGREHPSTYFVQDRSNIDEMERLKIQDQTVTRSMGGTLPEQNDPTRFQAVLDVGCGTGGWLIELAKEYPTIKRLVGVDISAKMIGYAREQAIAQGVGDRVEFAVMDALRLLEFRDSSFDLVNQRYAMSWLRKWDWPAVLREYQRVCTPGGTIRITEVDFFVESNSPALDRLYTVFVDAFYQAGHLFTPEGNGVISQLANLMQQYGISNVQTRAHDVQVQQDTLEGQINLEVTQLTFQNVLPFLRKWTKVPSDYQDTYQQMLTELQQPDFVSTIHLLTAWGLNSVRKASKTVERD